MLLRWGAVALCLSLGAGIAFLTLEFAGMPMLPLLIVLGLLVLIRPLRFPETLVAFGVGFSGMVTFFLFATSGVTTGEADPVVTALYLGCIAVGVGSAAFGVGMLARGKSGSSPP
jgi:multisubunit Na+/H+ antiporter MnhC subunit